MKSDRNVQFANRNKKKKYRNAGALHRKKRRDPPNKIKSLKIEYLKTGLSKKSYTTFYTPSLLKENVKIMIVSY